METLAPWLPELENFFSLMVNTGYMRSEVFPHIFVDAKNETEKELMNSKSKEFEYFEYSFSREANIELDVINVQTFISDVGHDIVEVITFTDTVVGTSESSLCCSIIKQDN